MIPSSFDYRRVESAEEALGLLTEHGDEAKLLAGGHSLIPLMKLRLAAPALLVDVGRLADLSYVREEGDEVAVGALTRHRDLETSDLLKRTAPLLAHVAGQVGDPQVRHRGTLGGSLAHGDPASDLPSAVLAQGGTMIARGPGGLRRIAATDFFSGLFETALAPDEMLVEVRVSKTGAAPWSFQKFHRRAQDWAIVGATAVAHAGERRVALVNMGPSPMRAQAVEQSLAEGAGPEEAASHAAVGCEPPTDVNASDDYRRHLARVLVLRALEEIAESPAT